MARAERTFLLVYVESQEVKMKTFHVYLYTYVCTGDTKKRELLKNPTKIEEIQKKKFY